MAWLAAVYLKHLCGFYLTRGYLSANSIVNRPCPNRRFILCHRAADQSNRIKNNEIARISLTKKIYIYIYPRTCTLSTYDSQCTEWVDYYFPFFPLVRLDRAGRQSWSISFENQIWWKKKRERAPLAPMWDTQRELSINLCIKKLIFTLYETSTSNPFPSKSRAEIEKTAKIKIKNEKSGERQKKKKRKEDKNSPDVQRVL